CRSGSGRRGTGRSGGATGRGSRGGRRGRGPGEGGRGGGRGRISGSGGGCRGTGRGGGGGIGAGGSAGRGRGGSGGGGLGGGVRGGRRVGEGPGDRGRGGGRRAIPRPTEGLIVVIGAAPRFETYHPGAVATRDRIGRRRGQGGCARTVGDDELATSVLDHLGPEIAEEGGTGGGDGGDTDGRRPRIRIFDE